MREIEIKCKVDELWRFEQALSKLTASKQGVQHNWYYAHPQLQGVSYRTRSCCPESDRNCLLVQKYGANPINGQDRVEIEIETGITQYDLGLDLENQGFYIESQWYRQRTTYDAGNYFVEPAINSGFGKIVELESKGDMSVGQLIDEANRMGLSVIDTELMNKAYNVVAGDSKYYNSFLKGRPVYIDWDELL